ncbi:MAG: hypothetical protein QHG99_03435 [Methanomicrobiales archaeon]|nr:hypothetical protein [Methanomicrobiales archaeon]
MFSGWDGIAERVALPNGKGGNTGRRYWTVELPARLGPQGSEGRNEEGRSVERGGEVESTAEERIEEGRDCRDGRVIVGWRNSAGYGEGKRMG